MTFSLDKIKALAAAVKETGPDLTQAQSGGGDYVPPAEGGTRLRFISYLELGVHTTEWQGVKKTKPRASLGFELSGPKHPPREHEGTKYPHVLTVDEIVGRHEKNGYMKLFGLMTKDAPSATNFLELLGNAYRATVKHRKSKDGKKTFANLKGEQGYTIASTQYEDPDTGEPRELKVDAPITALKVFLWDYADLDQWDAIFIDGTYDNGDSKNKWQEKIKRAENFIGSPIYNLLMEAGREAETIPAPKGTVEAEEEAEDGAGEDQKVERKAAPAKAELDKDEADPLAGV